MIVCPGNLAEQWQDELYQRFQLPFEILTNDKLESARTGNWFAENPMAICRLDKLSRNEDVQAKLANTDWDLIVCDEAHKMSATFFGNEVKYTKRYRLGQLLGQLTRHLLLMTATPHNGKPEDFQLFLALLRRRPLRRPSPRRCAHCRRLRPHASAGQGTIAQVRRKAVVSRAAGIHRRLQALRCGSSAVQERH